MSESEDRIFRLKNNRRYKLRLSINNVTASFQSHAIERCTERSICTDWVTRTLYKLGSRDFNCGKENRHILKLVDNNVKIIYRVNTNGYTVITAFRMHKCTSSVDPVKAGRETHTATTADQTVPDVQALHFCTHTIMLCSE